MEYPFKDLMPLDEVLEREGYYKDWTHLDPEVFYSLTQISEYIKTKGYGVDVRLLIAQLAEHFGLKTTQIVDLANEILNVSNDLTNRFNQQVGALTEDAEVIDSREDFDLLSQRLTSMSRTVNVKAFGARGDGSTDDTLAIQATIDYVHSKGGGKVYIPKGTFIVSTITGTDILRIYENVSLIGDGKNVSIIKVSNSTVNFGKLVYVSDVDRVTRNNLIEGITFDVNVDNKYSVTKQWKDTARVLLYLNENEDVTIRDCSFITNGIWAVRSKAKRTNIYNNDFIFDGKNINHQVDISTLWCGASDSYFYNNNFVIRNPLATEVPGYPATAMEIQGHRNKLYGNNIDSWWQGIIFTNSTNYENKVLIDPLLGAEDTEIYSNTIRALQTGINIWSMFKDGGNGYIKNLNIHDNNVVVKDHPVKPTTRRSFIKTHKANAYSPNPTDQKSNSHINNLSIHNNIFMYESRGTDISLYNSDLGLYFENVFKMDGVKVENNTFKNISGYGIWHDSSLLPKQQEDGSWVTDPNSNPYFHENILISNNVFENVRVPIKLRRNIRNVMVSGNTFRQLVMYDPVDLNMIMTIEHQPATYKDNVNIKVVDNTIDTVSTLKPYYPKYSYKGYELMTFDKTDTDMSQVVVVNTKATTTVPPNVSYLSGSTISIQATPKSFGTLVNASGGDVTTVGLPSGAYNYVRLSDTSNIRPLDVITVPNLETTSGALANTTVVLAVVNDIVVTPIKLQLRSGLSLGQKVNYA